uniref:Putative 8.9 kDa family member n=1 Tax=Rhipicephalus pulchellus TaxID=72859 RepID=L7LQC9_RHIPC
MSFHIMYMTTMSVVFLLLTHLGSSESVPYDTGVTEATNATESAESTEESIEFTDIPKILRLDCQYNGTTWPYNYLNKTNPECRSYFCDNGTMVVRNCTNGPPRPYANCIDKRRVGPFPICCYYDGAC